MLIRSFQPADESAVIALWQQCDLVRPWNDPQQDIQRKLAEHPELFLVGLVEDELIATVMAGYEGHRGWINYLAVKPVQRHHGRGRQMMAEAERLLRSLHCPKINLQVRTSNRSVIEFYQRLGYSVDEVVSLGKRLETGEECAA
jgi:ribosomal protein S18 acetylase RimI-like enzyme